MIRFGCAIVVCAVLACVTPRAQVARVPRLQVSGTLFQTSPDEVFQWRGISAFRLVEMVARGRQLEAAAFLDWAASRNLTVVRVLTTAKHLFDLPPEDGARALPVLLEMAEARGVYVEVVALADTALREMDRDAHVRAIGAIAAQHQNALVEIANEPAHPTQHARIHEPRELRRLAALVPDPVPVALGSAEENLDFGPAGDYATMHFSRGGGSSEWEHVLALAEGGALIARWQKPLVSDEPTGAAAELVPGRRDNSPARFRAAALLTRLTGMGATFHYEGGLHATIPHGLELECFGAWNEAWALLPADIEQRGVFRAAGTSGAAVASYARIHAGGVFERQHGDRAHVMIVDLRGEPGVVWSAGWQPADTRRLDGASLITAQRSAGWSRTVP